MPLRLPDEIVVEDVLPTIRAKLARELAERDITQQQIANHLGVTQAAVSKYVAGETVSVPLIAEDPRTEDTVMRIADGFASEEMDGYDALAELLELVRTFEDRGPICELHESAMPSLLGLGCDLCIRGEDMDLMTERDVLTSVRRAARILSTIRGIPEYIPNVGTNVGEALPDAQDETDIAAIPGRIYTIQGRVEVPANPEFGSSRHVATVVLAAMTIDPDYRGALNLGTHDDVLTAARKSGIEPVEFDAGYEDRRQRLEERFLERGAVPKLLYHRGAFGIEPITYVLGETAKAAADRAATIVENV